MRAGSMVVLPKLKKLELPYTPAVPFHRYLSIGNKTLSWKYYLQPHVSCRIICLFVCLQLCPGHTEVPGPGIKPTALQWPKPQQWQCQILNTGHQGTPIAGLFIIAEIEKQPKCSLMIKRIKKMWDMYL